MKQLLKLVTFKQMKIVLVVGLVFVFLSLSLITWIGFSAANYLSSEIKNLKDFTYTQPKEFHCLLEAKNNFLNGNMLNKSVLENYNSIKGCFDKGAKVCDSAVCNSKEQQAI